MANQDEWVERLRVDGAVRDTALAELRGILVRGLQRSLGQRGGGEAFIEDVVQEGLLRILRALDSFSGRSRFTTWAMTIAIRVGVSELRRKDYRNVSLQQLLEGGSLNVEPAAGPEPVPEQQAGRVALLGTLKQLIEELLTDKQRTVVQAFIGGLPMEEIARRLDSNRNAVYKLFHDARQKLRQGFEAAGIAVEDVLAALA